LSETEVQQVTSIANTPAATSRLSPAMASALLAIAALSWAGNHVIARYVGDKVPSWGLNLVRWVVVALLLAAFTWPALRADWPLIRRHWLVLAFLGAIGGGIFGALQYVGLRYTTALNMGVMNSVAPALIALASFVIFRDRISWLQVLGIAISLSGVVAIVSKLDPTLFHTLAFNGGDLLLVFNMSLWAVYSACLRLRPKIAATSFLFTLAVSAAVVTLPFAVFEYAGGARLQWTPETVGAITYAALISSLLAYVCWGRGVDTLGVTRAGSFLHLVPLFGAILATSLLGETLGLHHFVGFALILSGVTLAVRRVTGSAEAT
jgi:drug/metabolite transporter (DMT)-like permease